MIQEKMRQNRKFRRGVVVSSKMNKTVVVRVKSILSHERYGKVITRSSKCYAHDESGALKEGDKVVIMETKPVSKLKRWRVVSKDVA